MCEVLPPPLPPQENNLATILNSPVSQLFVNIRYFGLNILWAHFKIFTIKNQALIIFEIMIITLFFLLALYWSCIELNSILVFSFKLMLKLTNFRL